METWAKHMPKGMMLKSDGFATGLYGPRALTLSEYCAQHKIEYADLGIPVSLELFNQYAGDFQRRFVPDLDTRFVSEVRKDGSSFVLRLEDDTEVRAARVVMAIGITHFAYMPELLSKVVSDRITHSSEHHDLSRFDDQNVVVLGSGSSATDLAALLHEAGAGVTLVTRSPKVNFHDPPRTNRSFIDRLRRPLSCMGPGLRPTFYEQAPGVFRKLPEETRFKIVKEFAGPAGGWFMKERFKPIPVILNHEVRRVNVTCGGLTIEIKSKGSPKAADELGADHLIAATGFRVDANRLSFVEPGLRKEIAAQRGAPILSANFETSVSGLYLVGVGSSPFFGPVMRFVCGAKYAAPKLASHLARHR